MNLKELPHRAREIDLPPSHIFWGTFLEVLARMTVLPPIVGKEHATQAIHEIKENNASLLVHFAPHTQTLDPIAVTWVCQSVLSDVIKPGKLGWIASARFTASDQFKSLDNMGIASMAASGWIHLNQFAWFPVVQPHYLDRMPPKEKELATRLNLRAIKQAKHFINQPGNILMVSLEGHRNKGGEGLMRAQPGIDIITKRSPNLYVLPIVLSSSYPPFRVRILPLKPIDYYRKQAQYYQWTERMIKQQQWQGRMQQFHPSDFMMLEIAAHVASRGIYHSDNWTHSPPLFTAS